MNQHFTALVGKLTIVLSDHPETRLSERQERYLDELRSEYEDMRTQFARNLSAKDKLARSYIRCFDLSIGCLSMLKRIFQHAPGPTRDTYLTAFAAEVVELDALLYETESATAVRFAEDYLREARGTL